MSHVSTCVISFIRPFIKNKLLNNNLNGPISHPKVVGEILQVYFIQAVGNFDVIHGLFRRT